MATLFADPSARSKSSVASMTAPPNPHPGHLMYEWLASGPAWPGDNYRLCETIMRHYGCEFLLLLNRLVPFLPLGAFLRLGSFWRCSSTFRAVVVSAIRTLTAGTKRGLTSVAISVDPDANWFFHTKDVTLGRMPLVGLDLYTVMSPYPSGTLLVDMCPCYPSRVFILRKVHDGGLRRRFGAEICQYSGNQLRGLLAQDCVSPYMVSMGSVSSGPVAGAVECFFEEEEEEEVSADFFKIVLIRVRSPFLSLPSLPSAWLVRLVDDELISASVL